MKRKGSALLIFIFLLAGWGFSTYAGQITVAVPYQVRLNSAEAVANIVNALSQDKIAYQNITSTIAEVEANLNRLKGARYIIQPALASRGNLYILGASLVGSALFDYLINYLETQKNQYFSSVPPESCQYLVNFPCQYYPVRYCAGSGGDVVASTVNVHHIVGWYSDFNIGCWPRTEIEYVYLNPGECIDVYSPDPHPSNGEGKNYRAGTLPTDFLPCQGQPPIQNRPPLIIPPVSPDDVKNLVPTGDFASTITFPDAPNIKSPQDITPPMASSDGSVIYDIPNYSPDGVFSPDFTNPNNPVPDIPLNDPSIKVSYTLTNPQTNQTFNYNDSVSNPNPNPNPSNNSDAYTPTDKDLDTKIDVPEKKDLQTLIMSNIQQLKNKFSFDSSGCSGGNCSFTVNVFGSSATIDFCQFADLFSTIGTVILTFAYFYAFFIVVKGG